MSDDTAWLMAAEPGWVEIDGQDMIIGNSFVSGAGSALTARYYQQADQSVRAKVIFGPRTEGPPGCAHGGSMAAILDETLGFAVWFSGLAAFSMDLHVHYRKMLPIPKRCIAEAKVDRVEGRKVWASGRLRDVDGGTVFAEAEGIFLELMDRNVVAAAGSA